MSSFPPGLPLLWSLWSSVTAVLLKAYPSPAMGVASYQRILMCHSSTVKFDEYMCIEFNPFEINSHLNLNRKKYILKDGRNRCLPLLGWREECWGTPFSDLGSRTLSSRGPCRFSLRHEDPSPGRAVHEIHTFLGVWSPVHGCYVSELLLGCGRNQ